MTELFSQINALFQNNQVLSTVAGGSVIVWLVSNIKAIWAKLVYGIKSCISFTIINTYEDARNHSGHTTEAQRAFNKILTSSRPLWERSKNLDLSEGNTLTIDRAGTIRGDGNVLDLTYGYSIRLLYGKIVVCNRSIETNQKITINTVLRVYFANKKNFLARLTKDIEETLVRNIKLNQVSDRINIYSGECDWSGHKMKRGMDTIFTNNNEHIGLLEDIKTFIANESKYKRLAYPYSYSALLYGKPGTGKTSTILAIASDLNRDVEYVNLAKISVTKLLNRINRSKGDILVFEDIDAINSAVNCSREDNDTQPADTPAADSRAEVFISDSTPRKRDDEPSSIFSYTPTSLSDILNITDGLLASDGTICLFTTNHIEKLDPALLRAGRMNRIVEFSNLNPNTSARLVKYALGIDIPPTSFKPDICPADLQAAVLDIALGKKTLDDLKNKFCLPTPTTTPGDRYERLN